MASYGIALGAEYVETDPRPTRDEVLVNIHDATVDRTTDGTGDVDQITYAEIQALHVDTLDYPGDFSCERIPTLVEVLQTCAGKVVVLVDANKTDRVDLLVAAIEEANAVDWAIFDTSSVDKTSQALEIEPNLHFMIRPDTPDQVEEQLDHFAPRPPDIIELDTDERAEGSAIVHAHGTRSFSDVFLEDALAAGGDLSSYDIPLADGIDILQTERIDLVDARLRELGKR